jgi:ABC-type spermidine/putrescine transport system permease subunit II
VTMTQSLEVGVLILLVAIVVGTAVAWIAEHIERRIERRKQ